MVDPSWEVSTQPMGQYWLVRDAGCYKWYKNHSYFVYGMGYKGVFCGQNKQYCLHIKNRALSLLFPRYLGEKHHLVSVILCTSKCLVKQRIMIHHTLLSYAKVKNWKTEFSTSFMDRSFMRRYHMKDKVPCDNRGAVLRYERQLINWKSVNCTANGETQELSDEDDELCPVECVREIKRDEELLAVLEKAKNDNTLVVVDFYRTSCGSCKYIEQGFAKLCKGSGNEEAAVIFLKHNVIDEYDEQSDIAERLRIKTVPLFHFYKDGMLLEAFPTRDKERIKAAIEKYTAPAPAASQNA